MKFLWLLAVFSPLFVSAQRLVIYPVPKEVYYAAHNADYTVRVRVPGGEWQDLYEYNVKVDMHKVQDASMVYFDCDGPVEVFVRKNNGDLGSVRIRPDAAGIVPMIDGSTIRFTLLHPGNVSVEFNGDKLHNLHLFAGLVEKAQPDSSAPNVVYFGPGLHQPAGGVLRVASGQTVYIAGGAIVRAKLLCDSVHDVRIIGRGILDQPQRGVEVTNSRNVDIDGIIILDPQHYTVYGGSSDHLSIRNIKSFSCKGWSDGIDLMSCSDVTIEGVFMRNSDDCIALYAHRWDYYGNARNYSITHSILWADVAHPINIGLHGDTRAAGDTIENITFRNLDILGQNEQDPNYQGCMAISDGDLNLIRNIRFEDIRVYDFEDGQLLNLRTVYNSKYNTGPGRGIQDVRFKDISYRGVNNAESLIQGLDAAHPISGVIFENLRINGRLILDGRSGNIKIGPFTQGILFKK